MLTFVGLGLYDERSITVRGRNAVADADRVVGEWYTSRLEGTDVAALAAFHETEIEVLTREDVEVDPEPLLEAAEDGHLVFLTGGDPMISTTHVDLRLRAHARGVETQIVHAPSIASAAAGLSGLQNYRFGKATTVPFPGTFGDEGPPESVLETIRANGERGLHTLLYLDLDETGDDALGAGEAAELLTPALGDRLGVVIARAGSDAPMVVADRIARLAGRSFGPPLHVLIVPGELHDMEADALERLAGAPADALERHPPN